MATKPKKTADMTTVQFLTDLVVANKLDLIKFGDIEIRKTIHKPDLVIEPKRSAEEIAKEQDALLFQSGV